MPSAVALALVVQLGVFLAVVVVFTRSRQASAFHPVSWYLAFHGLTFVGRPLVVHGLDLTSQWRYMGFDPATPDVIRTMAVSSTAMLVFVGCAYWRTRNAGDYRAAIRGITGNQRRALFALALILLPLGMRAMALDAQGKDFEGTSGVAMDRDPETGIATFSGTTGYLVQADQFLIPVLSAIVITARLRWYGYIPIAGLFAFRAYQGWSRWAFVLPILSLLLISTLYAKRKWPQSRSLLVLVPLLLVFNQLGLNRDWLRDSIVGNPVQVQRHDQNDLRSSLDSPDFANYEFLAYVVSVVPANTGTYSYFSHYLQLFTEPIPRVLWSAKPIGDPIKRVRLNDHGNFAGRTTSLPGDGWISLGWAGVVITQAIAGLLCAAFYRGFVRRADNPLVVLSYCLWAPLMLQWFRDGGVSIAKFAMFALAPVLFWVMLSRLLAEINTTVRPLRQPFSPGWRRAGPDVPDSNVAVQ